MKGAGGERDDVTGVTISVDPCDERTGTFAWEVILYRAGRTAGRPKLNVVKSGKSMSYANAVMAAATKATEWLFRKGS